MSERKHTPLPWRANDKTSWPHARTKAKHPLEYIWGGVSDNDLRNGKLVARLDIKERRMAERTANAEFIVLACNAHYDLVEACEQVVKGIDPHDDGSLITSTMSLQWAHALATAALAKATPQGE